MQLTESGYPPRSLRKRYTQGRIEKRERERERTWRDPRKREPNKKELFTSGP